MPKGVPRGERGCAIHPGNQAISVCARCQGGACEVCRTRWRDQVLCIACVESDIVSSRGTEALKKRNGQYASYSCVLSATAWAGFVLTCLTLALICWVSGSSDLSSGVLLVLLALYLAAGVIALFGIGFGLTVMRSPDCAVTTQRATIGMVLGGAYLGILLGVFTLGICGF